MEYKDMLNQYISVKKEIEETRKKIAKVEKQIAKIEREGAVIDTVSGGDGGIQHFKIEGFPYPEYTKKKLLLNARQETLLKLEIELMQIVNDIELFISSIDDSFMRRIINLRFIERLSWQQVADRIGGNTEDSVRMQFERFMQKQ